jgi:dihydroflavonol-4-reductase
MNLITGATGLVGAHVALQLIQNNQPVVAIKRSGSDLSKTLQLFSYYSSDYQQLFNQIKWVEADVCDIYSLLDALDGITHVYHCAGFISFNSKDNKQLHQVNAEGTANIVNACLEKNIQAFCHVSSIATLHNPDITKNIDESVYWKSSPLASDYAISKYNGEREVWRGIEEGLPAVIVNPGIIFGPGFWKQSTGKLIETCYKGSPFYSNGTCGTVDVRNLATCMIDLLNKKIVNQRFILIEGNHSYKEILSLTHRFLNKKSPSIEAGKTLLTIGRALDTFRCFFTKKEPIITKATVIAALDEVSFNNLKIKSALTISFIPLEETLKFVCQLYLNEKKST